MISYTVGELKHLIKESSNEWKPVLGVDVVRKDVENNKKSYKEAEKRAKDYDGGLKEPKKVKLEPKEDKNRTTLDYNPTNEPDETYKKRVQAQMKGYNNEFEEKSKNERSGEFDDEGRLFNYFKDHNEEINDEREKKAHAGLVGKNMPKTDLETNRLYENKKLKTKRLTFKNTRFLNEAMMLKKIPESYKVDGQVIHMKDGWDNEYIVECQKSEASGIIETNVVNYKNKTVINEQLNRISQLMDYKGGCGNTSQSYNEKMNEGKAFNELMFISRNK